MIYLKNNNWKIINYPDFLEKNKKVNYIADIKHK
jgi:hypothetical protein